MEDRIFRALACLRTAAPFRESSGFLQADMQLAKVLIVFLRVADAREEASGELIEARDALTPSEKLILQKALTDRRPLHVTETEHHFALELPESLDPERVDAIAKAATLTLRCVELSEHVDAAFDAFQSEMLEQQAAAN